jgi:hypothetical protein
LFPGYTGVLVVETGGTYEGLGFADDGKDVGGTEVIAVCTYAYVYLKGGRRGGM